MTVEAIGRPDAMPLDEFAAALAKFQSEVPVIPKKQSAKIETQGGRNYTYTYADLAAMVPIVMPLLARQGLAFTALPTGAIGDRGPVLVAMLIHTSGQYVTGEWPITGRTPQEIGSSLTYGRRYLLGCLTGVVTDDDDDGALAERSAKARKRPAKPAPEWAEPDGPVPVAPPGPPAIQRRNRPRPVEPTPEAPSPTGPQSSPHGPPVTPNLETRGADSEAHDTDPTDAQRRALFTAVGKALGPRAQRDERLALCAAVVGRKVASSTDLGRSEISAILNWLEGYQQGRVGWRWDPDTESGHIYQRGRDEPPAPVEDVPLPTEPWVSHDHDQ